MGQSPSQFFTAGHGWAYLGRTLGNIGLLALSAAQTGVSVGLGVVSAMAGNPLGIVGGGLSIAKLILQFKTLIESDGQELNTDLKNVASGIGDTAVNIVNAVGKISSEISGDVSGASDFGVPISAPQLPTNKQVNIAPVMASKLYDTARMASNMGRTITPMEASTLGGYQKIFNQTASSSVKSMRDSITPLVNTAYLASSMKQQ